MNESNIQKTPEQLVKALDIVLGAGEALHTALGLTIPQLQVGQAAHDQTVGAIAAKTAAVVQVTAASQAKIAGKKSAVAALNAMQRTALASAATSEQLVAAGFPPRRTSTPRPATPQTVTGVKATILPDTTVRVAWDRGTNARATFLVEAGDGTSWTIVGRHARAKLDLPGIAPGLPTYLRVTAINAGSAASPSIPVSVYTPPAAAPVRLKLAA